MTPSEIQLLAVKKRWELQDKLFPMPKIDNDKMYFPYKYKCEFKEGYYWIPWIDNKVVVNENGDLFNLVNNKPQRIWLNANGYLQSALRQGRKYTNWPIQRIVAYIFNEIPDRHKHLKFPDLEVNHMDTVKTNNHYSNLEWMTGFENMRHAWENDLVKTNIKVLCKNIISNEIMTYFSISECSSQHFLSPGPFKIHLDSEYAGMLSFGNYIFKLDDGKPWPEKIYESHFNLKPGMSCDVVAENVNTGKKIIFNSIVAACNGLGLPLNPVKLQRSRKGMDIPYDGWIFYSLSNLPLSRKLKGGVK